MSNGAKRLFELTNKPITFGGFTFDVSKEIPKSTSETIDKVGRISLGTTSPIPGFEQTEEAKKARILQSFKDQQGEGVGQAILGVGKLAKTIAQETAKSGAAIGLTLATPFIGTKEIKSEDLTPFQRRLKEIIFGKDPVKSIQTRIAEGEVWVERFGQAVERGEVKIPFTDKTLEPSAGFGGFLQKGALPLSVIGVVGMIGLDFTTGGGKDDVVKFLAKSNKIDDIIGMLKSINVSDDLIPTYSKIIAKTNKVDDVVKVIDKISDIQKTTKVAKVESIEGVEQELRKLYSSNKDGMEKALGNIWQEMDMSEAGARFMTREGSFIGKESSFPDWIPEHLRSKKLFDNVMEGLYDVDNIKFPAKNKVKQRELFNILLEEAESRVGINASELRDLIVKNYGEIYQKTTTKGISGSIGGGISELPEKGIPGIQKTTEAVAPAVPKTRKFLTSVENARPDVPLGIGGQYIPRSTDDLAIKAKNLIADNIQEAERIARTGTDDKAVATASELIKHYSDEATKTADKAAKDILLNKASEVAHLTASNLTEQGRAIQAASILGRQTPEGFLKFAAREINKYNDAVEKAGFGKKIPQLTTKQTSSILTEYKNIQNMADGTKKAMATKQLTEAVEALVPSPFFKKVLGVWKAGLLSGLKTSGLNTMSNLFHGVSEVVKDIPAAVVDSVASLFTGKRTLALTGKGTLEGIKEGFEKGWRYLTTGFDERNIASKLDYRKVNFGDSAFAKTLQKYEESIFHLMGAEDQPFFYGAKARSLYSQAIAKAKTLKLKGAKQTEFIENLVKSPTDDMLRRAVADAELAVFQNPTTLGKAAKAIQGVGGGIGEIIVPFGRTPSAVAMQFVNYSPVGIVKSIVSMIRKGKFDQRLFSQEVGRGLVGTGLLFIGAELAKNNLISTNYPTTEKEQELWEAENRKPNSIKIGGKWRSVATLGPPGYVLIAGASYQESFEETGSQVEALGAMTFGGIKSLSDQTFLQGIKQITNAINDPERYGGGYFSNLVSSVVPTLVGDVSKAIDPKQRRKEGFFDALIAKVPFASQTLEPKVDVFGRELGRGNWLESLIDPSRPTTIVETPVSLEIRRLLDAGFNVAPTELGDRTGYDVLTPEETTILWKNAGEIINSKLGNLIGAEQYKKLDNEQKAEIIASFINKSKTLARAELVLQLTQGLSGQTLKDKLSELKAGGLMTQSVFNQFLKLQ